MLFRGLEKPQAENLTFSQGIESLARPNPNPNSNPNTAQISSPNFHKDSLASSASDVSSFDRELGRYPSSLLKYKNILEK